MPQINIPSIGQTIILDKDWNFILDTLLTTNTITSVNKHFASVFVPNAKSYFFPVVLPLGTVLTVEYIYIRKKPAWGLECPNHVRLIVHYHPNPKINLTKVKLEVSIEEFNKVSYQ
jgi:hypothetical protein